MPFVPHEQIAAQDITEAADGALLLPLTYRYTVLKARTPGGSVFIELGGDQRFRVRQIVPFDHKGDLGLMISGWEIEVDADSAYVPGSDKTTGDLLVGDDWHGICATTGGDNQIALRIAGAGGSSPRVGYRVWRIVKYPHHGEPIMLFEKHPASGS